MTDIYKIYVPLVNFYWSGTAFAFSPGLEIRRMDKPPELKEFYKQLSRLDKDELQVTRHWLCFDHEDGQKPSSSEMINLFFLALWLANPTPSHASLKFKLNTNPEGSQSDGWTRFLDQFSWIEPSASNVVTDSDLQAAANFFPALLKFRLSKGRLYSALSLTQNACMAFHWHVAFICYSAATESILTSSSGGGITKRLAAAYASLVTASHSDRDLAFNELKELYSVRSDILHGRVYTRTDGAEGKLALLARLETAVRHLWRAVISTPSASIALEGDDQERTLYFRALQDNWQPK